MERRLTPLSHGSEALIILREALQSLARQDRQTFLNQHLACAPISYDAIRKRVSPPPEPFAVLQGDVIRTDAAYVLGIRRAGGPNYAVATSTCDAIPGRQESGLLLPLLPRRATDRSDREKLQNELANLIAFKTTRYLYLPPLPDDDDDVLYNVALLDPFAQCANQSFALAERRASMTLLGWRIFGALLRSIQVREAPEEVAIRTA